MGYLPCGKLVRSILTRLSRSTIARGASVLIGNSPDMPDKDANMAFDSNSHQSVSETYPHKAEIRDGDDALNFLRSEATPRETEDINEKQLVRKIDWMVMPLMFCCYCLQFLDKSLRSSFPIAQMF